MSHTPGSLWLKTKRQKHNVQTAIQWKEPRRMLLITTPGISQHASSPLNGRNHVMIVNSEQHTKETTGEAPRAGPKTTAAFSSQIWSLTMKLFGIHQCTQQASSLGLATGSCLRLWSNLRFPALRCKDIKQTGMERINQCTFPRHPLLSNVAAGR